MPDYKELRAKADGEFLIEGPNSGGVYGMLLVGEHVWWFTADWTPRMEETPMSISDFLARYGEKDTRGYKELTEFLRARGH